MRLQYAIFISLISLFAVHSCKEDTKNAQDILGASEINLSVDHRGCFGNARETIRIWEEKEGTFVSRALRGTISRSERTMQFDRRRQAILWELINRGQNLHDSTWCTGTSTYTFETPDYRLVLVDNTCTLGEHLEKLF